MKGAAQRARHAIDILRAAIAAAEPGALVQRALHGAPELNGTSPIRLLAIGKAAAAMAHAVYSAHGDRIHDGIIVQPHDTSGSSSSNASLPTLFGAHPLPDESSLAAGHAVAALLKGATADELVVAVLSGGASAIAVLPYDGVGVADYAACVAHLLRAGADIRELNLVRRHIDTLKGGGMARLAAPARVLCLVLSDVVGDPLDVIASGPFTPLRTAPADALRVLRRHGELTDYPPTVVRALAGGAIDVDDAADFESVRVRVVGGNDVAVEGAARRAAELGYHVHRAIDPVTGPASAAGCTLAREALHLRRTHDQPSCIVAGGETTVAVAGSGRGGRNQELVLAACIELAAEPGITVAAAGTDGVDGPTDSAGAVVDEHSLQRAAAGGIDAQHALRDNDSHSFHEAAGGLIRTGPTGTNVNDVLIALTEPLTSPAH